MVHVHLTARCSRWETPLCSAAIAPTIWRTLRHAFPAALGCVLMPNHFHLVAAEASAEAALEKLRAVISGVRRSTVGRALQWERTSLPSVIPDRSHLRRQLRYVALNPCRAGLASDPLAWLWSTHRDLVGAVVEPWVATEAVARALQTSAIGFGARHHAYVSSDPSVAVDGTPFPIAATASARDAYPLDTILSAARAATRASPEAIRTRTPARMLFLDLARATGWRNAKLVGETCAAGMSTVRSRAQKACAPPPAGVGPARRARGRDARWSAGA